MILSHVAFMYFSQMLIGLRQFLGVGVLLCRGNRLLTGSNTRWLRLWEVEAMWGVKPQEKVCNVEDRSVAYSLRIPSLFLNYLKEHAILSLFTESEEHSGACIMLLQFQ